MKKISRYGFILAGCLLGLLFYANAQEKNVQSKQQREIRRQPFPTREEARELIKNRPMNPRFRKILEMRKNRIAAARQKEKIAQPFVRIPVAGNQRICNVNDIDLTNEFGMIANDPHIAVNPANQNTLIISSIYTRNAYGVATYTSTTRGTTWSPAYYHSIPVGTDLVENPTSAFSPDGNLYMAYHIYQDAGDDYIMLKTSPTDGITWPTPEVPVRTAPFPDFLMGPILAADYNPASLYYSTLYGVWSYVFNDPQYGDYYPVGELRFSQDGGANFYSAGLFSENFCMNPYVETGPAGDVYVAWSDFGLYGDPADHHIGFSRLDANTGTYTTPVFINMPPIEEIPLSYFNYLLQDTYPVIAVDKSAGPHSGRIYIVAASTSTFGSNHSDILMSYSDNNGDSWSAPVIVNQSAAGQCWNPWASVDIVTGELVVSYNCFENPYNFGTSSVYVANSQDGGTTFTRGKITDVPFELTAPDAPNPTFYKVISRSAIVTRNRQQNIAWIDERNANETNWKLYTSFGENHDIIGQDPVCNCGVFSVTNLAPNATVTWSASPSSAVTITPGSNGTATVCRVGGVNQMITLSAVISGICNNLPFTRQVMIGNPVINGTYISNGVEQPLQPWTGDPFSDLNNVCFMQQTYTNMNIAGAASVNWTKVQSIPNQPISWNQNGINLNLIMMNVGQTAIFRLSTTNACGNTIAEFNFKSNDCSGGGGCRSFAVSPNPAKGEIKVYLTAKPPACARTSGEIRKAISAVRIYDNAGNLKRSLNNKNSTEVTVNLQGLKTGVYIVEIADGEYTERQQVIIQE